MNWRAWNTFQVTMMAALLALAAALAAAGWLRLAHGELSVADTRLLLRFLYWGSYPLAGIGLVALAWHFVRSERGDYV